MNIIGGSNMNTHKLFLRREEWNWPRKAIDFSRPNPRQERHREEVWLVGYLVGEQFQPDHRLFVQYCDNRLTGARRAGVDKLESSDLRFVDLKEFRDLIEYRMSRGAKLKIA